MQAAIHPSYHDTAEIRCSCGNVVITGSTRDKMKTELCSKCHPFYTGQQKLVDTAGRVDKFKAKQLKAESLKEETKKRAESKKKKPEAYKEKEVPVEVLERAGAVQEKEEKSKWGGALGETLTEEVKKEDELMAKAEAEAPAKSKKKAPAKKAAMKKKIATKKTVKPS